MFTCNKKKGEGVEGKKRRRKKKERGLQGWAGTKA